MSQQPHIAIIVEYDVPEQNRKLFMERLFENCDATLKDDGCLRMEVSQPIGGDGRVVFLTERWRDQASIDKHREQPGHDQQHERVDSLLTGKRVAKCHILND